MKKKSLFIMMIISCILYITPTKVFSEELDVLDKIYINYYFSLKDNNNGNLTFKLYDSTGTLSFDSKYDESSDSYYFNYQQSHLNIKWDYCIRMPISSCRYCSDNVRYRLGCHENATHELANYFKYINDISNSNDIEYDTIPNLYIDKAVYRGMGSPFYNFYDYIPLVIENMKTNEKIIVLAAYNYHSWYAHSIEIDLVNTTYNYIDENVIFFEEYNSPAENIQFMRNAVFNYSTELLSQFNNNPIASSEMSFDNSDTDLSSPKVITFKTNSNKSIYSKYKSNVNYKFKVKNGNGMKLKLHDISNTFNFSSTYDKSSDTYSIVDNSSDNDYSEGIKDFSKIIIDEVKNGNFSGLANKYNSITSDNCSESSCNITTYIPLILEGENNDEMFKQIVLGLMNIQYREENGNDYYDIGLSVYNNTCDLLSNDIDVSQSELINLSRAVEKDYSSNLMNQYSDGSISMEDIYEDVDVNTLKDKYCNELPVISLRQNPKTLNNGIVVLIISMMIVIGSGVFIIKRRNVKV